MFRAVPGMQAAAGRSGGPIAALARAGALAAALCVAGGPGAAAEPGPREVIGHAGGAGGGATRTWTLPADQPYLFVPSVGPELNGAVASVETGAGVGAVLFQRPYYRSRDLACSLDLGVEGRSDLKWIGQVGRFEPRAARIPSEVTAAPDPATGGYGSLIVYRADLGPPPGVLLMHRRRTLGTQCPLAAHKTLYDRMFIPVAAPPEARYCVDLANTYPREGGEDIVVTFNNAERLAFLQPVNLDARYDDVRHAFAAVLFEGLGCQGQAISFKSGANALGDVRLSAHDFRARARSVLIAYERGALTPYMDRPAPAEMAEPAGTAPAPPQAAASEPKTPAVERSVPMPEPATATVDAPAPAREPETAAVAPEAPAPDPLPAPVPDPEPLPAPAPETARLAEPAPKPAAPAPSAEPAQATGRTGTPESVPERTVAPPQPPDPAPAPAAPAEEPAPVAEAQDPEPRAAPASGPERAPDAAQQAMSIPKIVPKLPPPGGAPDRADGSRTFRYPVHEIYRLNFCLNWQSDCGAPAAQAWCRAQGFTRAGDWKIDENIGGVFPTIVLGEARVCAQSVCDGFLEITCVK